MVNQRANAWEEPQHGPAIPEPAAYVESTEAVRYTADAIQPPLNPYSPEPLRAAPASVSGCLITSRGCRCIDAQGRTVPVAPSVCKQLATGEP